MKKLTKIFLIASAVCLVLGIILFAIGIKNNGLDPASDILKDSGNMFNGEIHVGDGRVDDEDDGDDGHLATVRGGEESVFGADDFDSIDISIGATHAVIKPSTDGDVHVINNSNQDINAYIMGDKLKIKVKDDIKITDPEGLLIIQLPEGLSVEDIDMSFGAAEIETEGSLGLEAENIVIDLGAGNVVLNGIETDKLEVNVGAGSIELGDTYTRELEADLGMGNITYQGDISGDMSLKVSMGNADFTLDSTEDDHSYRYDIGAGSLSINGRESSGFGASTYINDGADSDFDIDLSMGNVSISFIRML